MPSSIVLVGAPNAGKSTLFNKITGKRSKTVNYPGSTVDIGVGTLKGSPDINIVDTPGLYSLNACSEDEVITLRSLTDLKQLLPKANAVPELVLSVVDVCQLSRHLILTKQLLDRGYPVVVVLSMSDQAKKQGVSVDSERLSEQLDCPVLYNHELEANKDFSELIATNQKQSYLPIRTFSSMAKVLYKDVEDILEKADYRKKAEAQGFDLDRLFLHPIWGGLSFLAIMGLLFYSIFFLAGPLMDLVDAAFGFLNTIVSDKLPQHFLTDLLTEGIITGFAAILVFVPQIALLFLGIGLLESTGYLARGAVIADKPLSFLGLNGRCFVPLLSGFACAIPALMATRNIQQSKIRLICCFIIPLMQCSARLPVYGLLLALLFGKSFWISALVMVAIYVGSLLIAAIVAVLVRYGLGVKESSNFSIELPKWQLPKVSQMLYQTFDRTVSFVKSAGPIILAVSFIFWLLSTFPNQDNSYAMMIGQVIEPIFKPMGVDWRVAVAILLSFVAREVFVSALLVLFSLGEESPQILTTLKTATFQGTDELIFTTPTIVGLILFFMIAMQCGATFAVARAEMKSTKLAVIQLISFIAGAYLISVVTVQVLRLFF